MKQLTVFTPTYNRAYCLEGCYNSLTHQTCKEFIWLVIDDGSTDNTRELVEQWKKENRIEIKYVWQENLGMHGAHNTAYKLIETELNVCIDSDDYMPNEAVEKIIATWNELGSDKVSGIIGLDSDSSGKIIGSMLPTNLQRSTLFNLYQKFEVTGDKKLVYRTELTKHYPYPIFANEKYVGLACKYYKLDQDYEMILLNEVLCCVEYLPDGSSRNMLRQYIKNPRGFAFYRKELMKLPFARWSYLFRQAIHYVSSNIMIRNWRLISESPRKAMTLLALPLGTLLFLYIKIQTRDT
jgi:glycosyltransferase involved in cell wall biosynthesis